MKARLDKLVKLDAHVWHQTTMGMAWYFRTAGQLSAPPVVLAAFNGEVPDKETWARARKLVNATRRAERGQEQRYAERQKKEKRRRYIREYMREYRRVKAAPV